MKKFIILIIIIGIPLCAMSQEVRKHVVKKGETLALIAQNYRITTSQIEKLNKGNTEVLFPGLILKIPISETENEISQNEKSAKTQTTVDAEIVELKDGSFLECKIMSVSKGWITLRQSRFNSKSYRVPLKEIDVIRYSNGNVKRFK